MKKLLAVLFALTCLSSCQGDGDQTSTPPGDSGSPDRLPALQVKGMPFDDALVLLIPRLAPAAQRSSRRKLEQALDQTFDIHCHPQCDIQKASDR